MDKRDIRKTLLNARRELLPASVESKSAAILANLKSLPELADAAAVLTYVSSKDNEVDTHALIRWLLQERKPVLVPVARTGRRLDWSVLYSIEELAPAQFGILEPRTECLRVTEPPRNSAAIVPGIAFTKDGHRIGYGGGYYDVFLAGFDGPTIAPAFELQLIDNFPRAAHDFPVSCIVTENRIIRTRPTYKHYA
jgi:5-formyltetrahydrofolate cyclo-ligase